MKIYIVYYEKLEFDSCGRPYIDWQIDSVFDSRSKAEAQVELLLNSGCHLADWFTKEVQ